MALEKAKLTIASTTSIQNSGLFDVIVPAYERATGYGVLVTITAVGTGKAIRMAKKGEADLLFVHDPFREEKFVAEGYGVNRRTVMHNEFVILGPAGDPAGIAKTHAAVEAFEDIAAHAHPFVSRGDDSGTNIKERDIWDDAGVNPRGKGWYFETGTAMAPTLLVAGQKNAYTLSDMGTYLNHKRNIKLEVLFGGDAVLMNYYSVIAVNPERFPKVRYREAMDFIAYVTSREGQKLIAGLKRGGVRLFQPDAVPSVVVSRQG